MARPPIVQKIARKWEKPYLILRSHIESTRLAKGVPASIMLLLAKDVV